MKRNILLILGIILVGIGLFIVYRNPSSEGETLSMKDPLAPAVQLVPPQAGDTVVILETTFGVIKMKLFPELAPETSKNFAELAKRGFYNSLLFHRVIKDFMIQGGDPLGNGTGGETYKGAGTVLPDEISVLRHIQGAVSMANRGPNTATSQFFMVHPKEGAHFLDGKYTVFGQVFEGIEVVDAIAKAETDASDRPVNPVKIIKVEVIRSS